MTARLTNYRFSQANKDNPRSGHLERQQAICLFQEAPVYRASLTSKDGTSNTAALSGGLSQKQVT
jgi:hypothetical protein